MYFIYKHQTVFLNVFKGWDYFIHFTSELYLVSFLQLDYFTHLTCSALCWVAFLQLDYFTHFTYTAVVVFQSLLAVGLFHSFYIFSSFFVCSFFSVFLQFDYFTHFTYSAVVESFSCSWTISPILHIQHYVESFSCSWTISPILHIQHYVESLSCSSTRYATATWPCSTAPVWTPLMPAFCGSTVLKAVFG